MLTPQQLQSLKVSNSPQGQASKVMTPEEARTSFSPAPVVKPQNVAMQNNGIIGSEKNFGQSIADALYAGKATEVNAKNIAQHSQDIQHLSDLIRTNKAAGKDTTHVETLLKTMLGEDPSSYGGNIGDIIPSVNKSKEQIIGEAGGVLTDLLTGAGALTPTIAGAAFGLTHALQQDKGVGGTLVDSAVGALGGKILEYGFGKVSPFIEKAVAAYGTPLLEKLSQYIPKETLPTLQKIADKATIGKGTGGTDLLNKIQNVPSNIASKVGDTLLGTSETTAPLDETRVNDLYNRAIKPTVAGKNTATDIANTNTSRVSGLKAIADNKSNLTLTDINGEKIIGEAPQTVDQLSQAIQQTKASIFQKYDALAKQAGEKGVVVSTPEIANELQPVIESKSLAIANPKAIEYAKAVQNRLNQVGEVDAQTAQDVIQHYNESLKAFYRNPSYETASNASIDALIANKFRESLDRGITGATGEQYQALKSQYGALASMEKDVTHRNIVWGRQNNIGLVGNIANITSGAELVRGLVTMNPTDIAVSLGIKGVQKYMKYLNNPDVGVSKIFSEIENASLPSTGSMPVSEVGNTKVNSSYKKTIPPNLQSGNIKTKVAVGTGAVTAGAVAYKKLSDKFGTVNYTDKSEQKFVIPKDNLPRPVTDSGLNKNQIDKITIKAKVDGGLLPTLMMLESSMGTNKKSADKGEQKWLTGMTDEAIKEVEKKTGKKIDINNKKDILYASAIYFKILQSRFPNKSDEKIYSQNYWTNPPDNKTGKRKTPEEVKLKEDLFQEYNKKYNGMK